MKFGEGDDHALTLLKWGCANSGGFGASAAGKGTEGGAILLHFCGSPDPFFVQQNEPFLP